MATVRLITNPLLKYTATSYQVALCIAEKTPEKTIEAKTVADIAAALDAFAEELKATDKAWQVSTLLKKGERAPNGYNKAWRDLQRFVNPDLVTSAA